MAAPTDKEPTPGGLPLTKTEADGEKKTQSRLIAAVGVLSRLIPAVGVVTLVAFANDISGILALVAPERRAVALVACLVAILSVLVAQYVLPKLAAHGARAVGFVSISSLILLVGSVIVLILAVAGPPPSSTPQSGAPSPGSADASEESSAPAQPQRLAILHPTASKALHVFVSGSADGKPVVVTEKATARFPPDLGVNATNFISAFADINADGRQDIVAAQVVQGRIQLLQMMGIETNTYFEAPVRLSLHDPPTWPLSSTHLLAADYNNDGAADVILAHLEGSKLQLVVYPGRKAGSLVTSAQRQELDLGETAELAPDDMELAATDVNNDGEIDIAIAIAAKNGNVYAGLIRPIKMNWKLGALTLVGKADKAGPDAKSAYLLLTCDPDGDGKAEIRTVVQASGDYVQVRLGFRPDGTAEISPARTPIPLVAPSGHPLQLATTKAVTGRFLTKAGLDNLFLENEPGERGIRIFRFSAGEGLKDVDVLSRYSIGWNWGAAKFGSAGPSFPI